MSTPDEEAEMAKMMGFSGFSSGSKPPPPGGSKKRKLNTTSPSEARSAPPRGIPLGNGKGPNPNLIAVPAARTLRQKDPPPLPPQPTSGESEQQQQQRGDDEEDGDVERAGESEERPLAAAARFTSGVAGGHDELLSKPLDGLTGGDLARLGSGVKMADGRTVYFRTSFLEDPWA
jgi:hypothetical protein